MVEKDEQEPTQSIPAKDGDLEVPIPSREDFLRTVEKVAGSAPKGRRVPDEASAHEHDSADDERPSADPD